MAICQEIDGYGSWALAKLIVKVAPCFCDLQIHHFGRMRVRDLCLRAIRDIAALSVIRRQTDLLPSVLILLAACVILRKIRLRIGPSGSRCEHHGRSACDTILEKLYFQFCRALAVVVIIVIPYLRDFGGRSLGREIVGIGDRCKSTSVIGIGIRIVRRNLFLPLVSDLSTVLIDREIFDLIFPAVCVTQCNTSDLGRADIEIYDNRSRLRGTAACVDPCLLNGQRCLFRSMRVRDRCFRSARGITALCISCRYGDLFPCVLIKLAACVILRKIYLFVCPVVGCFQGYSVTICTVVLQELYGQSIRTHSVLIVTVGPYLRDLRCCLLRREVVAVRDGRVRGSVSVVRNVVVSRNDLFPCVRDLFSVRILRKTGHLCRPAFSCLQCYRSAGDAVDEKFYINSGRTVSCHVIVVAPGLCDLKRYSLCLVGVCDRRICSVCLRNTRISGYTFLKPGVNDLITVRVKLRKTCDRIRPVISFAQSYFFAGSDAIREKLDFESCRTLAVLVVAVIPDLRDGRRSCVQRCVDRICDRKLGSVVGISRVIARRNLFFDCIHDLSTGLISIQLGPCISPAVAAFKCNRIDHLTICEKINSNRGRTL